MGDTPDKPRSVADELRRDPGLYKRLYGYVLSRTCDRSRADDVTNEVFAVALEGKSYVWNGATPILQHLGSIANSLMWRGIKSAGACRERLKAREDEPDPDKRDSRPSPMSFAAAEATEERKLALAAEVVAHFEAKNDRHALGTLALTQQGTRSAEAQARVLECTVNEIRRARDRVRRQSDAVVARARKRGEWP